MSTDTLKLFSVVKLMVKPSFRHSSEAPIWWLMQREETKSVWFHVYPSSPNLASPSPHTGVSWGMDNFSAAWMYLAFPISCTILKHQFAFLGTKLQYLTDFEASLGDHGYSACSLYLIHVFLNAWNGGGNKCVWGWCFGEHGCHDSGRTKSNKLVLQPTVYCEHNMHVEVEIHFQLVTGHDFSLCECFHCGFAVWHLSLASPSGFHVRFVPCFFFFFLIHGAKPARSFSVSEDRVWECSV